MHTSTPTYVHIHIQVLFVHNFLSFGISSLWIHHETECQKHNVLFFSKENLNLLQVCKLTMS